MTKKAVMKKLTRTTIDINEASILVKIYEEPRRNVRASMTKNGAILRIPLGLTQARSLQVML